MLANAYNIFTGKQLGKQQNITKKVKVKLSLCLTKYNTIKTYRLKYIAMKAY